MNMPAYFEFCCRTNIVAGEDALERLPLLLESMGAGRPMIITDKGVRAAGMVDLLLNAIAGCDLSVGTICDEVPMDSDVRLASRLAGAYRAHACDALVALGGGSVLDTAKGVNIVVSEDADLMDCEGAGILRRRLAPLIAVPTTAGTGSEVTQVAVISDPHTHRKHLFLSYFLQPDAAVIDLRMTLSLPPVTTAQTGMDALCHAVEAYTCLGKNPLSDGAAMTAATLISRHLLQVVRQPQDRRGRLAMASAAVLAGVAFSNSMTGMAHALGHALGGICGVPHGACMAVFLPYALEYNMHRTGDVTAELLLPLAGPEVYARTPKHRRAEQVVASVRQLNQDLHDATGGRHARFLSEMRDAAGHPPARDRLGAVAAAAVYEAAAHYNPEEFDRDDCLMVLEAAWEGRPLERDRVRRG